MVEEGKKFTESSLKKGQDPEVWIMEFEDIWVRFDNMNSRISENQFMIHILNNPTADNNLPTKKKWYEEKSRLLKRLEQS
jgi:hypothetical protein